MAKKEAAPDDLARYMNAKMTIEDFAVLKKEKGKGQGAFGKVMLLFNWLLLLTSFMSLAAAAASSGTTIKKKSGGGGGVFVPPSNPDYADLEKKEKSKLSSDPAFIAACQEKAGYYEDMKRNPTLAKTILIAGVNNGYKDFLHNFKCHTDRLGIKFLPISLDEGIYGYITNNNLFTTTYLMKDIPGRDRVAAEPSGFGGKNFNLIGCRKMEAVAAALELGYDVVFSDVDIGFVQDPINYLFFPGIDYIHSTNKGCGVKWSFNETMEGNTGNIYELKITRVYLF